MAGSCRSLGGFSFKLLLAFACLAACTLAQETAVGFIRVSNGRFVDATCHEYRFSGWNGWNILEAGANKIGFPGFASGQDYIRAMFQLAKSHGMNIMRFFLAGDRTQLIQSPGVYDEESFKGLDFILDEAAKAGIKLTIVPVNLWKRNGGVQQFEEWCGSDKLNTRGSGDAVTTPYDWYVSPTCRQMYKDYLAAIVNRVNTINGLRYRDDPVIFSWNLINEPRCSYCGPEAINDWIADVAAFLKSVDPNHMVTTGEEGFFDDNDPLQVHNPQGSWADHTGQDFVANHAHASIDYAVMHMWPDNWKDYTLEFGYNWINSHVIAAQQLGKPLVLEEYGKNSLENEIAAVRDPWFKLAHDFVEDQLNTGGPLRGVLFWEWDSDGTGPRDGSASTVRDTDTTITNEVAPFSQRVTAANSISHRSTGSGIVPGCTPVAPPPGSTNVTAFSGSPGGRRLLAA